MYSRLNNYAIRAVGPAP